MSARIASVVLLLGIGLAGPAAADFATAHTEFDAALAAPLCDPLDARLAGFIRRRLRAARASVAAAEGARDARAARLLARADRKLAGVATKAVRAEERGAIDGACRTTIEARVAALRDSVAMLRGRGDPPLPGLPADVAGYERWLRLNAEPIPPRQVGDAHHGIKNVFVN